MTLWGWGWGLGPAGAKVEATWGHLRSHSRVQCCQPSVKITETSVFSVVESGGSVIRNLSVK